MSEILIPGIPNKKQKDFFASKAKYTAYGGARGGGKSWALRRKLVGLCLRYPGICCIIIRRSYAELEGNHVLPFLREYGALMRYSEGEKTFHFENGSVIKLGYCSSPRDSLRYQGQEFDIIAIDEATQLREEQFEIFKACLRGVNPYPKRMYLTCNPGGVGHAWVKRLFIDRKFRSGERPEDYLFIPALVYDNPYLTQSSPDYVRQLETLPEKLKKAWLDGSWDVFEGQFFPEFDPEVHVRKFAVAKEDFQFFAALDYGFDMLAALLVGYDRNGTLYVIGEVCQSSLTLSQAAQEVAELCRDFDVRYAVASPDLWNRRQDTGLSGFEIMSSVSGMPPLIRADNRRVAGWRVLRDRLSKKGDGGIVISPVCENLIASLPSLLCDRSVPDDASGTPHAVTHSPEALRYAVMSRPFFEDKKEEDFSFLPKRNSLDDYFLG